MVLGLKACTSMYGLLIFELCLIVNLILKTCGEVRLLRNRAEKGKAHLRSHVKTLEQPHLGFSEQTHGLRLAPAHPKFISTALPRISWNGGHGEVGAPPPGSGRVGPCLPATADKNVLIR